MGRGRCHAQGRDVGGGPEASARGVEGQMAQVQVGEVQVCLARGMAPEADALAGEGLADVVVAAFVGEVPGAADDLHFVVRG